MARAGLGQHHGGGAHAARIQALGQPRLQHLRLAAGPALVLGQLGQALAQFGAQPSDLFHQVVPVRKQAADLGAGGVQVCSTSAVGPPSASASASRASRSASSVARCSCCGSRR
jgi:hypothetical protein